MRVPARLGCPEGFAGVPLTALDRSRVSAPHLAPQCLGRGGHTAHWGWGEMCVMGVGAYPHF